MGSASKTHNLPVSVAESIGHKLVKHAGYRLIKPTPTTVSNIGSHHLVATNEQSSKKTLSRWELAMFGAPIVVLLVVLSCIGYMYAHYIVENRAIDRKISSIKSDNFALQSAQAYLSNNVNPILKAKVERISQQPITLVIGTNQVKPSPGDIMNWLDVTNNQTKQIAHLGVNTVNVLSYVNSAATKNTHGPINQISVLHPDGTTTVLVTGISGVTVSGVQAAVSEIDKNLLAIKGLEINLPTAIIPFSSTTKVPPGKLLEADITHKVMYAYQDSNLIRTFLVSAGAPLTPTPTGTFHIYAKYIQQDMSGYNVNGTKYFQPAVPYVNYFYEADAVHGNYWRPASWFGNINSSHGCIGVNVADSKWIYGWAPIGTTVIVHK